MHAEGPLLDKHLGSSCSLAVVTDVNSPNAIEDALPQACEATDPTVCASAACAHTCDQCGVADKPSIAPNVAARNHPPLTSPWLWIEVVWPPGLRCRWARL